MRQCKPAGFCTPRESAACHLRPESSSASAICPQTFQVSGMAPCPGRLILKNRTQARSPRPQSAVAAGSNRCMPGPTRNSESAPLLQAPLLLIILKPRIPTISNVSEAIVNLLNPVMNKYILQSSKNCKKTAASSCTSQVSWFPRLQAHQNMKFVVFNARVIACAEEQTVTKLGTIPMQSKLWFESLCRSSQDEAGREPAYVLFAGPITERRTERLSCKLLVMISCTCHSTISVHEYILGDLH